MRSGNNLTVHLEKDVIRQARILAAKRGTSISKLVSEQIERLVAEEERYESARANAFVHLEHGFALAAGRISRDELHER